VEKVGKFCRHYFFAIFRQTENMSEPPDPWSDLERSHRDEHRPDEGQRYTDFEDTLEHNGNAAQSICWLPRSSKK